MEKLQKLSISEKDIYVFEDHARALSAWAEVRRQMNKEPNLITLDCHTDTHSAFIRHIIEENNFLIPDNIDEIGKELCKRIDYRKPQTIEAAIIKLKNDEHINAAVLSNILNYVFIISYNAGSSLTPFGPLKNTIIYKTEIKNDKLTFTSEERVNEETAKYYYDIPENRIYELPTYPGFNPPLGLTGDEEKRLHCDVAIEKHYLDCKVSIANAMAFAFGVKDILSEEFILDIDLDYFRTAKSIQPDDPSTFYKLIRRARAITIALEPEYVIWERIEGENITSDFLYPKLLGHIEKALKNK